MNTKERKLKCRGELDLAGYKVSCFVSEDGTRLLSNRGMQIALKIVDNSEEKRGGQLRRFLSQKSLQPFISKGENGSGLEPAVWYWGEMKVNCYEATVLVDICDGMLEARKNMELDARQKIVAEQSEILLRAFAKVGIIALIDEATGYQYERESLELQKILDFLVLKNDSFSEWKEMFSLGYYKDLYGVYGVILLPKI